ncbi:MAG: inositol monophosphatase family protein [SAR202 cluster bacterium]|nr:inositol monophosphatase family protein [SAR202 cluster bacterium]
MVDAGATLETSLLEEVEGLAAEIARGGGVILAKYFGAKIEAEYKDKARTDPVTIADRECQQYLVDAISNRFPLHGIVGEEDDEDKESANAVAPDTVWILDPLDGTKNFVNGLPVFACSVGVIHRGMPVAGAIYLPWPAKPEGSVLHARSGSGTFQDGQKLEIPPADTPIGSRLMGLPGSFGASFRFKSTMQKGPGELRVSGSIAFEMAMAARGTLQYAMFGSPRLWDVAAGVALVIEAGGAVMLGSRSAGGTPLQRPSLSWTPARPLVNWTSGKTTIGELRRWSPPLLAGSPGIVLHMTDNLMLASSLRRRVSRTLRRKRSGSVQ